jgi:serine phosphatase RsbU (regulator of sigma subunit)
MFSDGRVGLAVGDVSGKGVSAALLMATSISLFNASMSHASQPSSLLASLDTELVPYTMARNQNCALCYIDIFGSTLRIANAGGIPPYIRRADGSIEWPDVWGFALGQGLGAELGYSSVTISIAPGDIIVLVSDGVVEATNNSKELFGFERLERTIASGTHVSAQAMVDYILLELNNFVGNTEPHDDATIAAILVRNHVAAQV